MPAAVHTHDMLQDGRRVHLPDGVCRLMHDSCSTNDLLHARMLDALQTMVDARSMTSIMYHVTLMWYTLMWYMSRLYTYIYCTSCQVCRMIDTGCASISLNVQRLSPLQRRRHRGTAPLLGARPRTWWLCRRLSRHLDHRAAGLQQGTALCLRQHGEEIRHHLCHQRHAAPYAGVSSAGRPDRSQRYRW